MANTKSTQHEIDLTSELNLNKFKADIKPYNGFNERNSPYYGGALSPLFCKNENVNDTTQFYNGHKYYVSGLHFYKDDIEIMSFSPASFRRQIVEKSYNGQTVEVIDYFDDDNYIFRYTNTDGEMLAICTGRNVKDVDTYDKYVNSRFNKVGSTVYFVIQLNNSSCVYGNSSESSTSRLRKFYTFMYSNTWGFLNLDYLYVDNTQIQINTTFYDTINHRFILKTLVPDSGQYFTQDNKDYIVLTCGTKYAIYTVSEGISAFTDMHFGTSQVSRNNYAFYINEHLCFYRDSNNFSAQSVKANTNGYTYTHISSAYTVSPFNVDIKSIGTITKVDGFGFRVTACNVFNSDFQYLEVYNSMGKNGYSKNTNVKLINISSSSTATYYNVPSAYSTFTDVNNNVYHCSVGNIIDRLGDYRVIYNPQGAILGISCTTIDNIDGTLLTSWGSVSSNKPVYHSDNGIIKFFDADLGKWVRISSSNVEDKLRLSIIDKYAVINTASYYNCVDLETGEKHHWASDWNNTFYSTTRTVSAEAGTTTTSHAYYDYWWTTDGQVGAQTLTYTPKTIAGGKNVNWLEDDIPSIKPEPIVTYELNGFPFEFFSKSSEEDNIGCSNNNIDIYINSKYVYTLYEYIYGSPTSTRCRQIVKAALVDTTYPGDAVRNNLPLLFDVIQGPLDTTLVNFGSNVSFFLIYYDNINRYQYYNSSITEFEDFFVIQGQTYGIARDKIYSLAYANGAIQSSLAIAPLEGLIFIGNTIYNAYFYSPTVRAIYSFGADNNLQMFTQADTITGVTGSTYLVGTGSLIIGTPECTYVLNERFGIYRLPIQNMKYASQLDGQVVIVWVNNTSDLRAEYIAYEPLENYTKQNVVLDTAFYGAGSNVVSVNDCWYIRVTDTERGEGEIKLSVSTLTDVGRTTEERTFKIKAKDWDELTDTVYIRFQPKLQRAVGVSLHIESPFKVGYIGVGATPETLQLNKGTI